MNKLKLNNISTQLGLCKDVIKYDQSILNEIRFRAAQLFKEMIEDRMFIEDDQTKVEFTVEEFNKLRVYLAQLSISNNGLDQLSPSTEKYLFIKKEKEKIIRSLEE